MAEEGIAAHWKYKDGPVTARDEQRLAWLRQVVEWQRDISDPSEFLSTLKIDLYPDEVAGQPALGGYQLMVSADIFRTMKRRAPLPISMAKS